MDSAEALSYAIFAINTLMHPDASAAGDIDDLELHVDEVLATLVKMRNEERHDSVDPNGRR